MRKSTSVVDSSSQGVLDELETARFTGREVQVERVTVVKFRLDQGSGDACSSGDVEIWANATEVSDVEKASLGNSRDLVVVSEVGVENETKISCR